MITDVLRALRRAGRELRPAIRARSPGEPAVFELIGHMPKGFVELELSIGEGAGPARVIAEVENGTQTVPLALRRNGVARTLVRLPELVRSLRLEVEDVDPVRSPVVSVRELSRGEAAVRLATAVLARRLREPWSFPRSIYKLVDTLRKGGTRALTDRLLYKEQHRSPQVWYADWRRQFDSLSDGDRALIRARSARLATRISVLMPVYETPEEWLTRAIGSVRGQLHPNWELCIADDASRSGHVRRVLEAAAGEDPRIRIAFRDRNGHICAASNTALSLATGDFIALLDHDDELPEHALYLLAEKLATHPDADLLYSDEDKLDAQGRRFDPHFKPDWNPDLLLSHNYVGHLCAARRTRVLEAGGFREGFEGSQDHDLCLRVGREGRVHRVPFVLYHWRAIAGSTAREAAAKTYTTDASVRAVAEHLGQAAIVTAGPLPNTCRVRWPVPEPPPLVSLIIPTRDGRDLLEACVESLLRVTAYRSFELIVVDNQSGDPRALEYLSAVQERGVARVLRFDAPFNFSALNNFAVREARGSVVGLLNNDLEIIDPGWLQEMVSQALRPDIGAVGARLLYPDRTVQHAGIILGIAGLASHAHKHSSERDDGYFLRARLVQNVSAVTAACLLIRRDTYLRVGGLDEELPVAFNDVDFCLRVRATGLRNLWTPFATLIHHESRTRGADDTPARRSTFRTERDRVLARWGPELLDDPAYNPNLTLESEDFSLAWPPRVRKPWA
jgi:glycosyltransferase involved in cell wall biosynthesis